jgi:hypothetical protein
MPRHSVASHIMTKPLGVDAIPIGHQARSRRHSNRLLAKALYVELSPNRGPFQGGDSGQATKRGERQAMAH